MRLILGMDRWPQTDWTVRDLDHPGLLIEEDAVTAPRVYWTASYWPEVLSLCEFDAERQRLKLPTLADAPSH